jgi:vitamin B12 transporter
MQKVFFVIMVLTLLVPPVFAEEEEAEDLDPLEEDIPVMEGEGLTITGVQETTQQVRTIDREEIDRVHAPELASLLELALDLPLTRYGPYGNAAGVNIRGFGSGRVAFLIDGVPVNSPQSGEFDLSMIDVNAIDHIEVVYGGSDTAYNVSGALGGLINIVTLKKEKPGLRLGGLVSNTAALPGSYYERDGTKKDPRMEDLLDSQKAALSMGMGAGDFSWSANVFANRAANHFIYQDYYGIDRRREHNEVWDSGLSTSFFWDLPGWTSLATAGDFYYGDKNIPGPVTAASAGNQRDLSVRQNLSLDMPRVGRDDLAAVLTLGYSGSRLDYEDPASDSLHRVHTMTAINRWSWYPLTKLTLKAGGDYRFSYLDSTNIGVRDRHEGGFYLTAEYAPHKRFLIIPSTKIIFDANSLVPVPKLGLAFSVTDSLTLKNNYFRSFKLPGFNDLYWGGDATAQGNPDLKPEDGIGADIGAEYRFKNLFSLEGTFYGSYIRNSIHWRSVNRVWKPVNVGEAAFFGLDTKIRGELPVSMGPVKKLILSLSYQYLLSYILTESLTFSSNIRMPYMPMHTLGASLEIPWSTGSLLISGHYEGLRYTETLNIRRLDPHFVLNLNLNQRLHKNLSAFAVLRNVLNQSYTSMLDYPMPGLTITLGARMELAKEP